MRTLSAHYFADAGHPSAVAEWGKNGRSHPFPEQQLIYSRFISFFFVFQWDFRQRRQQSKKKKLSIGICADVKSNLKKRREESNKWRRVE